MPFSKETLQAIAREAYAKQVTPAEAEEVLVWLTPALDGLTELDALELESVEPTPTFTPSPAAGAAEGMGAGDEG